MRRLLDLPDNLSLLNGLDHWDTYRIKGVPLAPRFGLVPLGNPTDPRIVVNCGAILPPSLFDGADSGPDLSWRGRAELDAHGFSDRSGRRKVSYLEGFAGTLVLTASMLLERFAGDAVERLKSGMSVAAVETGEHLLKERDRADPQTFSSLELALYWTRRAWSTMNGG